MTIQNTDSQNTNKLSDTKLTIINNGEIEDKLNVIIVHFNPVKLKRIEEFSLESKNERLMTNDGDLFIAELSYDSNLEITENMMMDMHSYRLSVIPFSAIFSLFCCVVVIGWAALSPQWQHERYGGTNTELAPMRPRICPSL